MDKGLKDVHLVLLIHGLWGSPAHLAVAKKELEDAWASRAGVAVKETTVDGPESDPVTTTQLKSDHPPRGVRDEELVVVVAGGMTSKLTYDGIDVCASRVAWEVDQQIAQVEEGGRRVTRFSVTGYSLGGLVARYLVGLLHSRSPSFFEKHKPVTFSTIATPHLGVPRYNTVISSALVWLGARLLSRSGEQLYVADSYSDTDRRPLLEIMADPNLIFYEALDQFEYIQFIANGINDTTVPYPSAAVETVDHFAEWEQRGLSVNVDEHDLIIDWQSPEKLPKQPRKKWISMGTLPPFLRYPFPYNYLIILLFPIMLPLVFVLLSLRLLLDSRKSRQRINLLSQPSPDAAPSSPIPSPGGLSVDHLREIILRVERELESDLISAMGSPEVKTRPLPSLSTSEIGTEKRPRIEGATSQVLLTDSQLRMALWLNQLPVDKLVTWYPGAANSHAISIVRDPDQFPAHNRGRKMLKRWAQGVLCKE